MENEESLVPLSKYTLIIRDNKIIQAKNDLSNIQNKFVDFVIGKVREDPERKQRVTVTRKEFAEVLGVKHDKYLSSRMFSFVYDLAANKSILVLDEDRDVVSIGCYFEADYHIGESYVTLDVGSRFYRYFVDLDNKEYTGYHLQITMSFSSNYAIQLYKLLKQYMNTTSKKRKFDLDEFRFYMDVESKYTKFGLLKKNVIQKAVDEINNSDVCDIRVQWEPVKTKNKYTGLIFYMTENREYKSKEIQIRESFKKCVIDITETPSAELLMVQRIDEYNAKLYGQCFDTVEECYEFIDTVRKIFARKHKTIKKPWSNYLLGALEKRFKKTPSKKRK